MWKWEWICWLVNLISRDPDERVRRFRRLIERLSREADLDGNWWGVFRNYPKKAVASTMSLSRSSSSEHSNPDTAIVVQGPVIEKDDLTFETLKLYRGTMPHSRLILSTWNGIRNETRDRVEALGVTVVTSKMPDRSGPQNLNFQITSTHRGLSEAKRVGCHYAMKTRTDTRIHMTDVDQFCKDLIDQFPIKDQAGQKERLITVDFATRLYMPYHLSDLMMFGTTDDLLQYWSPELCGPELQFRQCIAFDEMLQQAIPEIVICRRYLETVDTQIDGSLGHWWDRLAKRFMVIDREMIDFFWPKYNYNADQRLGMTWDVGNMALCHFAQWLQLHSRQILPSISMDQLRGQRIFEPMPLADNDILAA